MRDLQSHETFVGGVAPGLTETGDDESKVAGNVGSHVIRGKIDRDTSSVYPRMSECRT